MIPGFEPTTAKLSHKARSARAKGANAEREIVKRFADVMNEEEIKAIQCGLLPVCHSVSVKRNTLQSDGGGFDIHGVPLLAIEVKRHETLACNSWFEQACRQAKKAELPVLIFRQSNKAWRVITWVGAIGHKGDMLRWMRAEVSFADFLSYYGMMYASFLRQSENLKNPTTKW